MSKKRFTLIELLVVIAIIAILAAILLPALQSARTRAQMTKCISNLKQMGTVSQTYMDDHRGFWPTGNPFLEKLDSNGLYTMSYISNFYKGKYIGQGAVSNKGEDFARCESVSISRDPGVRYPQVYGTQYVHNGSVKYAVGSLGYLTSLNDFSRGASTTNWGSLNNEGNITRLSPSQRVLLFDNVCYNTATTSTTGQCAYTSLHGGNTATYLSFPYLVHNGKINCLTVACNVASPDEDTFCSQYYFPYFGGEKASSVLATDYIIEGVKLKNANIK